MQTLPGEIRQKRKKQRKEYFLFVGETMAKITPEEKKRLLEELNIEQYPKNEKGFYILPDAVFDKYMNCLPDGTVNESGNRKAFHGGCVRSLTSEDKDIQRAGGEALQAKYRQRRSFAETIDIMLSRPANTEDIAKYGLNKDATQLDAITAAAVMQAAKGNIKAQEYLRDTAGEKPVDRQEISGNIITDADKSLIDKIQKRLDNMHNE